MRKLTHLVAGTVVTAGALLAFASPASAQSWPCNGCGDTIREATTQWPCTGCVDTTQVESPAADTSTSSVGFAALGGLTAVGLAGLALRRRTA